MVGAFAVLMHITYSTALPCHDAFSPLFEPSSSYTATLTPISKIDSTLLCEQDGARGATGPSVLFQRRSLLIW